MKSIIITYDMPDSELTKDALKNPKINEILEKDLKKNFTSIRSANNKKVPAFQNVQVTVMGRGSTYQGTAADCLE